MKSPAWAAWDPTWDALDTNWAALLAVTTLVPDLGVAAPVCDPAANSVPELATEAVSAAVLPAPPIRACCSAAGLANGARMVRALMKLAAALGLRLGSSCCSDSTPATTACEEGGDRKHGELYDSMAGIPSGCRYGGSGKDHGLLKGAVASRRVHWNTGREGAGIRSIK